MDKIGGDGLRGACQVLTQQVQQSGFNVLSGMEQQYSTVFAAAEAQQRQAALTAAHDVIFGTGAKDNSSVEHVKPSDFQEMLDALALASFPGFIFSPDAATRMERMRKALATPLYSAAPPQSPASFMADWLAFQAAEREERENPTPVYPGTWPPKIGLEFPR